MSDEFSEKMFLSNKGEKEILAIEYNQGKVNFIFNSQIYQLSFKINWKEYNKLCKILEKKKVIK